MKVTLKALRANMNLTQEAAASQIGVTKRTLQNWESNVTSPTASQLMKICEVYSCGLSDIFLPDKLALS